ncbi:MAG: hypothetical protein VKK63_04215 [Synechococcus sp.]|nr:hypothetical protein [Synechococcus sp.]
MSLPPEPGEAELQQRLEQLIGEQGDQPPPATRRSARWIRKSANPIGLGLAVMLALTIGVQLSAIPWRFRREIWQLQGAVVGVALGVLIGRFSARRPDD